MPLDPELRAEGAERRRDPAPLDDTVTRLPKVEIYVTGVCNNRCTYCATGWENAEKAAELLVHVPRGAIRAQLEASYAEGARRVLFQGGEPTIRRDLGELVADARAVGYEATTVFTNARAAASPFGARWLASLGVTWFQVSVQGGTAEAHDASVAAPRAFRQTVEGIDRLLALGQRVKVNGVLTRHLLDSLDAFAELMIALGPEEVGLDVVRPSPAFAPGRASYPELLPKLSGYSRALADALLAMNRAGVVARVVSCPPCLVPGAEQYVSEEQETTITQIPTGELMHKLTQRRSLRTKAEVCEGCARREGCPGLFSEYVAAYGTSELHPIRHETIEIAPRAAMITKQALRIPPDQGPVLRRMLTPGPRARSRLLGIEVRAAHARATYATPHGQGAVMLRHRSVAEADVRTERFSIEVRAPDASDRDELLREIVERVRAHEQHFAWSLVDARVRVDPFDVEQVALLAGKKPALRTVLDAPDAEALVRFYAAAGFSVAIADAPTHVFGEGRKSLYVACTDALAQALRHHDLASFAPGEDSASHHRALGLALGFPACCVEAFLARWSATRDVRPGDAHRDELFDALVAADVDRPHARLNTVPRGTGPVYASFEPCRLDCPSALATVSAIAEALDPRARSTLDGVLARPYAVSATGTRFAIDLDPEARRIRDARVLPRARGEVPAQPAIAAAQALVGRTVAKDGFVIASDAARTYVVDFGASSRMGTISASPWMSR